MTSQDYMNSATSVQSQMDPMLNFQGQAPDFFKQGLNKAFDYNLPLLKEGANLEAGAYALPGQLMNQYNQDFGNVFGGASSGARINSILGRLGNQFALSNLAGKLSDQQGGRINDMATSLAQQYGLNIDALKTKFANQMSLAGLAANNENAAAARAADNSGAFSIPDFWSKNIPSNTGYSTGGMVQKGHSAGGAVASSQPGLLQNAYGMAQGVGKVIPQIATGLYNFIK